jgi:hypothetical protein
LLSAREWSAALEVRGGGVAVGVAIFTGEGVARAGEAGFLSKVFTLPLLGSLMMIGLFLAGMTKLGLGGTGLFDDLLPV